MRSLDSRVLSEDLLSVDLFVPSLLPLWCLVPNHDGRGRLVAVHVLTEGTCSLHEDPTFLNHSLTVFESRTGCVSPRLLRFGGSTRVFVSTGGKGTNCRRFVFVDQRHVFRSLDYSSPSDPGDTRISGGGVRPQGSPVPPVDPRASRVDLNLSHFGRRTSESRVPRLAHLKPRVNDPLSVSPPLSITATEPLRDSVRLPRVVIFLRTESPRVSSS